MTRKHGKLGRIIHEACLVERWELVNAINTSMRSDKRLGEILVERGQIDEETLTRCIAMQYGLEYVDVDKISISPEALTLIPEEIIKQLCIIPFDLSERTLKLIVSDPTDQEMMDTLRFCLNTEMECYLACPTKIRMSLNEAFSPVEISGQSASDPVGAHDHSQCALQDTKVQHKDLDTQRVEIKVEVDTQNQKKAKVKTWHAGYFFTKMNPFKIIWRGVARIAKPHFKRCKSCWIQNSIPTDYSDRCLSCERCGRLIRVQPSLLALALWSAILLIGLAAVIYGKFWR